MIFQAYGFPLLHASHQIGRVGKYPCCKTLSVALHSRPRSTCWINQPVMLMSLVRWNRLVDKITLGPSPPPSCPLENLGVNLQFRESVPIESVANFSAGCLKLCSVSLTVVLSSGYETFMISWDRK